MFLVTGATGFVGSHLLDHLVQNGQAFRCLTRPDSRRSLPSGTASVAGDLESGAGLDRALDGVDAVIHLAGVTKALKAATYYTGNGRASAVLAKAMAGKGIRLVHVSSLAAVGPSPGEAPINEDAVPAPFTHYGKSKLEAEKAVRGAVPEAVIVRPPVVYGPRDTDVFQILKSVARGVMLQIGEGERYFNAIYAGDLAEGLVAAALQPGIEGRTYFLANPKVLNWTMLGEAAARIMGRNVRTIRIPEGLAGMAGFGAEIVAWMSRKPGIISREKVAEARCRYWTCDPARARADMGFAANTQLEAGLAKTLAWYKEAGWIRY